MLDQSIINKLRGVTPDFILLQLPEISTKFNITTPLRLAHFLSQCSHESGNFTVVKENLNYSAQGLKRVFPKYFPGNLNESYARQPDKIANRVYANRMGNGSESSGDGYRFSGRGYIQLTGKNNYALFNEELKKWKEQLKHRHITNRDIAFNKMKMCKPNSEEYRKAKSSYDYNVRELTKIVDENLLETPTLVASKYPLVSAAFYFNINNLWTICDRGADISTITALTRRINGGTIGLDDRILQFNKYYNAIFK